MKRHLWTLSLVLGAFALGAVSTQAKDDEARAKAERLAEVAGFDAVGPKIVDHTVKAIGGQAGHDPKLEPLIKALRAEAKPADLRRRVVEVYARHLDEASLDALLAFYATPAGKAVAAKQGLIGAETTVQTNEWLQSALNRALKSQGIPSPQESLERARRNANETAVIGALKSISNGQILFREGDKDQNNRLDYAADLKSLGKYDLIDRVLATGKKQGYRYKLCRGKGELAMFGFMVVASPVEPGVTGERYFATNHSGLIWCRTDKAFTLDPEKCEVKGGKVLGR